MNSDTLYSKLKEYVNKGYSSFHTPGHKCADFFPDDLLSLDLTELPETDALYEADGIILETEKKLAHLFSAKYSLISAGGCSLAIQAMLKLASDCGKKILMARNSHRTAINAAALLGLEPVWLCPKSEGNLFTGRISPNDVEKALEANREITACYITSPSYYGELCDIKKIANICHRHNVLLLVDNAHGSHLAFMEKKLHPILLGADMSACSLHKTMPVLTGGAVLNINNEALIPYAKRSMSLFGSTSPSYPIMASIDLCCEYMQNSDGITQYRQLEERIDKIKRLAENHGAVQPTGLCDPLRVSVNTSVFGITGTKQIEYFHRHMAEPEFCDGHNAVFICTPFNSDTDLSRLENAIVELTSLSAKNYNIESINFYSLPDKAMSLREAVLSHSETVRLSEAHSRIAADTACPCPPGIPLIMPGEIINEEVVKQLRSCGFTEIQCIKE